VHVVWRKYTNERLCRKWYPYFCPLIPSVKATELKLINFVWGDLNSELPVLFNLGLYRSSVAERLGLCEAQIGRIDFVEATGSFKN